MRSRKTLAASALAVLLMCSPLQLTAGEGAAADDDRAPVLEWFSSLWSGFAAWLAAEIPPPSGDGSCAIDPNGCPRGGWSGLVTDGSCAVDPFGCPHGG